MPEETQNDDMLKEIRDEYKRYLDAWREPHEEGSTDMLYVLGDPWPAEERKQRKDNDRPCLVFDELGQYLNQLNNDMRANKRSIHVAPAGNGADDKTAELHGNIIRGIEYESNAQAAYTTGFEGASQRSYGYWRVTTEYTSEKSFVQHLRIRRIANPDSVLPDPNFKEFDASDMRGCFVLEWIPRAQFKERYPEAKIQSFDIEHGKLAPDWITDDNVLTAEYWKVRTPKARLVEVLAQGQQLPQQLWKSDLPKDFKGMILQERESEKRQITQYITNGLEILEEREWKGKYIPIVGCFGRELWVDKGSGTQRVLQSLIRKARDPQMSMNYLRSSETELIGMTPKSPWLAVSGQLGPHEQEWQSSNKVPISVLQYLTQVDSAPGQVLGAPTRQDYVPQIQPLEVAAESCKRAIQASMGRYNTSVGKNDTNVKSGIAIEALDRQSDQGSFHFLDNLERSIKHTGRILEDLIPFYYDTARDVPIQTNDGTFATLRINDPKYQDPKTKQATPNRTDQGDHNVTISTGPSFDSQRQEATAFADLLISKLRELPIAPQQMAQLLGLAIKLKDLGPLGDTMVQIIDPQDGEEKLPPQVVGIISQLQAQNQQLLAIVNKLSMEKAAKVVDNKAKFDIEKLKAATQITIEDMKGLHEADVMKMQAHIDLVNQILGALQQPESADSQAVPIQ